MAPNKVLLVKTASVARKLIEKYLEHVEDRTLDGIYVAVRAKTTSLFEQTMFIDPNNQIKGFEVKDQLECMEIECAFTKINLAIFIYQLNKFSEITTCLNTFFHSVEFLAKEYKDESLDLYCTVLLVELLEIANLLSAEGKTVNFKRLVNGHIPKDLSKLHLAQDHPDYEHAKRHILAYREELLKESIDDLFEKEDFYREKMIRQLHKYAAVRLVEIKRLDEAIASKNISKFEGQTIVNKSANEYEEQAEEQNEEQVDGNFGEEEHSPTDNDDLSDETSRRSTWDPSPIRFASEDFTASIILSDSDESTEATRLSSRRNLPKSLSPTAESSARPHRRSTSPRPAIDNGLPKTYRPRPDAPERRIPKVRKVAVPWTKEETDCLEAGLGKVQATNWVLIKETYKNELKARDTLSMKDKAVNEIKRRTRLGLDLGNFKYAQRRQ
ncbi:hypothetical protein A0J61_00706 [Choanephora cucurbitarum]|uniref:Myb-like domain-containing protein n=1 Tax=Choanephora cucurbitarum TaxID=101091 RepID=A0A1C7NQ45_9FUNG|nr:hypothetical protein A0J61_00706 [Choanephora cucurbitarum]